MRLLPESPHHALESSTMLARPVWAIAAAVLIGLLAGCASDQAEEPPEPLLTLKPQPPYTSDEFSSTRLILKRQDGQFEIVSSGPSFAGVTEANVSEGIYAIRAGISDLIEYSALNVDGELLLQGYFVMPLTARVTFTEEDDSERIHHVEIDDPSRVVRVAIPYDPNIAVIAFNKLVPGKDSRHEKWDREELGEVRVKIAPAQYEQRGDIQ
ncbi:MAG: hypothetical protein AB2806_04175 [Candidatus Thiodiazotropha sp.]